MDPNIGKKIIPFAFSIIILSFFLSSMWNYSVLYSNDRVSLIEAFPDATNWLSQNIGKNETAILPVIEVFLALDPDLKHQSKSYLSFWNDAEVDMIHATEDEKNIVRQNFWNYISTDSNNVKYVVLTWNDIYMRSIFDIHPKELPTLGICTDINLKLKDAYRFNLQIPSTGWKNSLVICEVE